MGVSEHFSKLLSAVILLNAGITLPYVHAAPQLLIERKEDELLLPPYLRDDDGGILNVTSERMSDQGHTRSAKPGEWLEYGDSFSTPDRLSLYVWMNESLQWVAGGVFQAKIAGGAWNSAKPAYELSATRGWMKVWAKPSAFSGGLQIKTPKVNLVVTEGVFWLSVTAQKTELYVLSGTVKGGDQVSVGEKFYEWSGKVGQLQKTSDQWDFVSLENRISKLYPGLVKLSHRANSEWLDDVSSKKYAELRAKGWKKADRYFPGPAPKK